jgi:hypothetical protein
VVVVAYVGWVGGQSVVHDRARSFGALDIITERWARNGNRFSLEMRVINIGKGENNWIHSGLLHMTYLPYRRMHPKEEPILSHVFTKLFSSVEDSAT